MTYLRFRVALRFVTWSGAAALAALTVPSVGCGNSALPANGTGGSSGSGGLSAAGGTTGAGGATSPTGGSSGSFSWAVNGQTFSTTGYYLVTTADGSPGGSLGIFSNYAATPIPCNLRGQFASLFPPPGTYPIGDALQPIEVGTFVGVCNSSFQDSNVLGDESTGGQVVLTKSAANDLEGTFTMVAAPVAIGSGGRSGANTYTGAFAITSSTEP